jgi:hypothetical protein
MPRTVIARFRITPDLRLLMKAMCRDGESHSNLLERVMYTHHLLFPDKNDLAAISEIDRLTTENQSQQQEITRLQTLLAKYEKNPPVVEVYINPSRNQNKFLGRRVVFP